jgi:transcriptional regulator with XRE-family HTH domain
MKRLPKSNFATALRLVRKAVEFTQEDFEGVASRVHISALERGLKQPTLGKVDELANHMGVHPLTLLTLAYCREPKGREVDKLCAQVLLEAKALAGAP